MRIALIVTLLTFAGCIEDPAEPLVEPGADAAAGADEDGAVSDGGPPVVRPDAAGDTPDAGTIHPPVEQCDDEDALAPNQGPEQARPIEPGFARDDLFLCPESEDWYRLTLRGGEGVTVRLQARPPSADLDLAITDGAGIVLQESAGDTGEEELEFTAPAAGDYLVRISGYRDEAADYALAVESGCSLDASCGEGVCDPYEGRCERWAEPDCGDDANEPNDRDAEGAPLSAEAPAEGVLCRADRDWFVIDAANGDSFELLAAFPGGEDLDLFVVELESGRAVASATGDARSNPERLSLPHLPAGRYAVGVFLYVPEDQRDRDVEYRLEIAGRSGACEIDRDCGDALPVCDGGVCRAVDAGGAAAPGERCGDDSDCGPDAPFCWIGGEGGHDNFCTRECDGEGQCGDVGDGGHCEPVGRGLAICFPPCASDDDCSGFRECVAGMCEIRGECRVDGDCGDGEVCQTTNFGRFCSVPPPVADCGDDPNEPNSVSAEATVIEPDGEVHEGFRICDDDDDWFRVTVPEEKAGWLLSAVVSFREGADIDVYVFDDRGNLVGQAVSGDQTPEVVELRFIAPGDYLVRVDQFSSDALADTDYTVLIELRDNEDACTPEENQCGGTEPLRGACLENGACAPIEGGGEVELGGLCDSDDDCAEAAEVCWVFEGGEQGWNICTHQCRGDGDCEDVPGTTCTAFQRFAVCLPPRE